MAAADPQSARSYSRAKGEDVLRNTRKTCRFSTRGIAESLVDIRIQVRHLLHQVIHLSDHTSNPSPPFCSSSRIRACLLFPGDVELLAELGDVVLAVLMSVIFAVIQLAEFCMGPSLQTENAVRFRMEAVCQIGRFKHLGCDLVAGVLTLKCEECAHQHFGFFAFIHGSRWSRRCRLGRSSNVRWSRLCRAVAVSAW